MRACFVGVLVALAEGRVEMSSKLIIMPNGIVTEYEIPEAVDAARGADCEGLVLLYWIVS
jgi:hypothetical protein